MNIVHGDAFEQLADLPDDHAHAAVVDYPWEFEIQTGEGKSEIRNREGRGLKSGCREPDHDNRMFDMATDERFPELLAELARVLVDGAWLICMADDRFQGVVRDAMKDSDDWVFRRNWAWTPENMGMGCYGRVNHYPMPVATLGETDRYVQDRGTLFCVPNGRDVDYPTGKPADLYRRVLAPPVIEDGERLLEPFCGSAPGAAVAAERNLDYWGCDVDVDALERARTHQQQDRLPNYAEGD
ncbi:hypothetical protein G9464_20785 [Halostella sp. JP-L12]|uniref:hypothetical protein n=1 Tax=Halostella TaxID=1843185 RepID=UPI000EF840FB|nr:MULTISPECIES: hypothetical protein [Halostella]NHN50008.1 hypothetical protein [Halostella sp. JP-L12]